MFTRQDKHRERGETRIRKISTTYSNSYPYKNDTKLINPIRFVAKNIRKNIIYIS